MQTLMIRVQLLLFLSVFRCLFEALSSNTKRRRCDVVFGLRCYFCFFSFFRKSFCKQFYLSRNYLYLSSYYMQYNFDPSKKQNSSGFIKQNNFFSCSQKRTEKFFFCVLGSKLIFILLLQQKFSFPMKKGLFS